MTQQRIWHYFQNEGMAAFDQALPRYRFLARRLERRLPAGASVLNIGIGSGTLDGILATKNYSVSALDPDAQSVQRLRSTGIDARVGIVENLPFGDSAFDAVVATEVLEHLSPDECRKAVLGIARTLKHGGYFVGTVPYRERLADNNVVCPDCGHRFHRWGHQQSFDRSGVSGVLCEQFDVLHISRRSFVPWTPKPSRLLKSAVKWLLGRAGELIASPHLYFECRKRAR